MRAPHSQLACSLTLRVRDRHGIGSADLVQATATKLCARPDGAELSAECTFSTCKRARISQRRTVALAMLTNASALQDGRRRDVGPLYTWRPCGVHWRRRGVAPHAFASTRVACTRLPNLKHLCKQAKARRGSECLNTDCPGCCSLAAATTRWPDCLCSRSQRSPITRVDDRVSRHTRSAHSLTSAGHDARQHEPGVEQGLGERMSVLRLDRLVELRRTARHMPLQQGLHSSCSARRLSNVVAQTGRDRRLHPCKVSMRAVGSHAPSLMNVEL